MNRSKTVKWLRSKRVGILKGGWSRERPISLKTGEAVERSFRRLRISAKAIDVQSNIVSVLKKKKINFCFICLHGPFGEDGKIQNILDNLGISYTGSGSIASSLAMNKRTAKILFRHYKIPTPRWLGVSKAEFTQNPRSATSAVRKMLRQGPVFVKPVDQGSAIGINKVQKASQISRALKSCFRVSDEALVERFISGRELTVSILGKKSLPVIEIIPEHTFYDYHSKYAKGGSRHILPAHITSKQRQMAQRLSRRAFQVLGCSGYGRVDLIMQRNGKMMILETNTIPGMTNTSLLPEAAAHSGIGFDDLVLRIVSESVHV